MPTRLSTAIAMFVLACIGVVASPARAEVNIDIFGGAAWNSIQRRAA